MFSGLSIMKFPFHTTEKSTGSSLIFIPSYRYWSRKWERKRWGEGEGVLVSRSRPLRCISDAAALSAWPELPHSYITSSSRSWQNERPAGWTSLFCSVNTCCTLNYSLTFIVWTRICCGTDSFLPSCSGTARGICWSVALSLCGWPPGCVGHTHSPARQIEAAAGSWPSVWWV